MPLGPLDPRDETNLPFDPRDLPDPNFRPPDFIGVKTGWRAFGLPKQLPDFGVSPKLFSATYHEFFWTPRQHGVALCKKCGDNCPGETCRCGFYSAKTLDHLKSLGYIDRVTLNDERFSVIGEVSNWGKVIEGTQGWRAQKSYPRKLYVPFEARYLAKPLKEAYGVPVLLRTVLDRDLILERGVRSDAA